MTITEPCYATREQVATAADVKLAAWMADRVDRIIDGVSRGIEGLTHRTFYPTDATRYFDWPPDGGNGRPWRLWLGGSELASSQITVTSGGVEIDSAHVFTEPNRYGPPYTRIELDRSSDTSFGLGPTPQRDIAIQGPWGYWTATAPAGTLTAGVDGTATTVAVSNGATIGVGDLLAAGAERLLVTDRAMTTTGQTLTADVAGASAAQTLTVSSGAAFTGGETILVDAERMQVVDIAGATLVVKRAVDGSTLAAHTTGTTVYAPRQLTVVRAATGTTAAAHSSGTAILRCVAPALVRDLAVAEAVVQLLNETIGYARNPGSSADNMGGRGSAGVGADLPDLRARVYATYGRKARTAAI